METKFNFKSQICTTRSQSEALLKLGLKKETADMALVPLMEFDDCTSQEYFTGIYTARAKEDAERYGLDYIPAWSLHRLIEMMPKCITIDGDSAYPLQITKRYDGQWVVGYQGWYDAVGYLYDNIIFIYQLLISEGYIDEEFCNKG